MRAYVLFYKYRTMTSDQTPIELNHFKFFLYMADLAKFLCEQNETFTPLAIQRMNVSKSVLVETLYNKIDIITKNKK